MSGICFSSKMWRLLGTFSVSTLVVTVTMLGTFCFFGIGVHDSMGVGNNLFQNVMAQTQNFVSSTMKSTKSLICKILDYLVEEWPWLPLRC